MSDVEIWLNFISSERSKMEIMQGIQSLLSLHPEELSESS